jgi:hypothetical protein
VTDALPDAGALTTIGTDTARLTAARAGALTDWIDGGRLDTILDACATAAALSTHDGKLDTVDGIVDAILADTGTDGVALTAAERNAVADALLDRANAIETAWTVRKVLRIIAAACGGKLSGAGTSTNTIRDILDAKDRITATVDADGNRTAVTLDGT